MKSVDQIVEGLRNGIRRGAYAADGLLPPQKAMAKKMGLSARAVAAAYARLANEGLVRNVPHKGAVIVGGAKTDWRGRVLFITISGAEMFFENVLALHVQQALESGGYRCDIVRIPPDFENNPEDCPEVMRKLREPCNLALVMVDQLSVGRLLHRLSLPFVELAYAREQSPGSLAFFPLFDFSVAMEELLEVCAMAGVYEVLEVGHGGDLGDCLISAFAKRGIRFQRKFWDCRRRRINAFLERFYAYGYEQISSFLRSGRKLPDVFLFQNDHVARGAFLAFAEHGLWAPRDFRMVVCTNHGDRPFYPVDLSCLEVNPVQIGRAVGEWTLKYLADGLLRPLSVPAVFCRGKTL